MRLLRAGLSGVVCDKQTFLQNPPLQRLVFMRLLRAGLSGVVCDKQTFLQNPPLHLNPVFILA